MRIAVLDDYQEVAPGLADWESLDAQVEFFSDHLPGASALIDRLSPFEVIVAMRERTPFPRSLLAALPNLRLLVTTGMRNATIDLKAAGDLDITVCGTASTPHSTTELTMAFIHMLSRRLFSQIDAMRRGAWQVGLGRDLHGSVLGVIGLGRLGSRVAALGLAYGMEVIAWSENLTADRCAEVGVRQAGKVELLGRSDFVTLHLKLGPRSWGVIGRPELALMKPTAYLINTSRGQLVDTTALLDAVRSGLIAGAGLDVFDEEPLPSDDPLRREPRILLTPHIGYVTEQTYRVFYPEAVEDISAWMSGHPIRVLD
ncbi:MAG: D-2-hydroxyacid dehydrogenase family protein [Acidimicrobiia bacterium]|nr:D-2-hydroxyacid dehydrogenase family protein [Acidimicrobiia bacterium]